MKVWKITLEYDGTNYSGWQEQDNARTVMGTLRTALQDIMLCKVALQGSGRTDAGVHALGQVAHARARPKTSLPCAVLARRLNDLLPVDIAVLDVEEVSEEFHARHDAVLRSYVYQISRRKSAFSKRHLWWIKEPLDTEIMSRAAKMLEGRHNFNCFRSEDPAKPDESPIVVVERCEMEEHDGLILFRIEASHFLWRMVRRIVGVLVKLGLGEITMADFEALVKAKVSERMKVSEWTAPAAGLFLERVVYGESKGNPKWTSGKRPRPESSGRARREG